MTDVMGWASTAMVARSTSLIRSDARWLTDSAALSGHRRSLLSLAPTVTVSALRFCRLAPACRPVRIQACDASKGCRTPTARHTLSPLKLKRLAALPLVYEVNGELPLEGGVPRFPVGPSKKRTSTVRSRSRGVERTGERLRSGDSHCSTKHDNGHDRCSDCSHAGS